MNKLIIPMFLLFSPLGAESYLDKMSVDDKKSTGIDKLTVEEKTALDQWLQKTSNTPATPPPAKLHKGDVIGDFEITGIVELGHYFNMNNKETYEVSKRYRKKVREWKVGDKIRIIQSKKPIWFKFENLASGQVVGVKKIAAVDTKPLTASL